MGMKKVSLFGEKNKTASAEGFFVHVFVRRKNMKVKVSIPNKIKKELIKL